MKHLIVFFLLFNLTANAFSASSVCMMSHDIGSAQSQVMPCYDTVQDDTHNAKSHLCECDKCSQHANSFVSVIYNTPIIEAPIFHVVQHISPAFSPKYRPPIYLSI